MKHTRLVAAILIAGFLVAGVVWAAPTYGKTMSLYSLSGFVELLIERGIVPAGMAEKARTLVAMVSRVEDAAEEKGMMNAEVVEVSVSQLIGNSKLTYEEGQDVKGLLLLAKNTSDAPVMLEAKRGCQVVYRIYSGEDLVYDSATSERCGTEDGVTYTLQGGASRMFEVSHKQTAKALDAGTYRFELEYPGYGSGERTVTITK